MGIHVSTITQQLMHKQDPQHELSEQSLCQVGLLGFMLIIIFAQFYSKPKAALTSYGAHTCYSEQLKVRDSADGSEHVRSVIISSL